MCTPLVQEYQNEQHNYIYVIKQQAKLNACNREVRPTKYYKLKFITLYISKPPIS